MKTIKPILFIENTENGKVETVDFFKKKRVVKKKFEPKVGGYFYAVHNNEVKECRIVSIMSTRRPFDANWVKFRDVKTNKIHECYLYIGEMAKTKKQAKNQLVKKLRQEFKKSHLRAREATRTSNSVRKQLEKALKIKV